MSNGRQRFSIIPAQAVTDQRLEPRDLQVLCLLGRHTNDLGWCCRSQVKMAKELSCGRATVQRALGRLAEAGYVEHRPVQRASGADSAHDYRVVIDPPEVPEPTEIDAEGVPTDGQGCPPKDGQGVPTHGRAPMLTTPDKREEREGAREEQQEGQPETAADDPKAAERDFKRAFAAWPTFVDDSEPKARRAWQTLSPLERASAIDREADYVAAAGKTGRQKLCSFGVYLAERRWEKLGPKERAAGAPTTVPPFGKHWGAKRMALLIGKAPEAGPPPPAFEAARLAEPGEAGQRARLERQARYGWPSVNRMDEMAAQARQWPLAAFEAAEIERLAALTEQVWHGSPLWEAWRDEFARRGWPWLPDMGKQRVASFPRGGPGGLAEFQEAVSGAAANGDAGKAAIRGQDHDGGGREAAE